jgi:hypothetical protein
MLDHTQHTSHLSRSHRQQFHDARTRTNSIRITFQPASRCFKLSPCAVGREFFTYSTVLPYLPRRNSSRDAILCCLSLLHLAISNWRNKCNIFRMQFHPSKGFFIATQSGWKPRAGGEVQLYLFRAMMFQCTCFFYIPHVDKVSREAI